MRKAILSSLTFAAVLVLAAAMGPAMAQPDPGTGSPSSDSEATITLDGCTVDSSKEISYVALFDDGTQVDKDEPIDADTYDLTEVDGIDEIDSIEVKSGTTIETFATDCVSGDETEPDDGETEPDEGETEPDDDETEDEEQAASSDAQISLSGCVVESSKDISYIAYMQDGEEVDEENVNAPSRDLTEVDGIDEIDSIEVKSGTTVETFGIDCQSA